MILLLCYNCQLPFKTSRSLNIIFICFPSLTNLHLSIDVTSGLDLRLNLKHLTYYYAFGWFYQEFWTKHILKLYTGMFQMVDFYHVVYNSDWCWCLVPRKRYFDVRLLNQRNFIIKIIYFQWKTANTKTIRFAFFKNEHSCLKSSETNRWSVIQLCI